MGHLNLAPLVDKTAAYTIEYVWLAELEIDINSVKNTFVPIFLHVLVICVGALVWKLRKQEPVVERRGSWEICFLSRHRSGLEPS